MQDAAITDDNFDLIKNRLLSESQKFNFKKYYLFRMLTILFFFISSYALLLIFSHSSLIIFLLASIVLYLSTMAVVFNFMHDAAHNMMRNKKIRLALLYISTVILDFNAFRWSKKHIAIHHPHTGNGEKDLDIIYQTTLLKLSEKQKLKNYHKWQHYYYIPILGVSYFLDKWYYSFKKELLSDTRETSLSTVVFLKIFHYSLFIFLPLLWYPFFTIVIYYLLFFYFTALVTYLLLVIGHAESPVFSDHESGLLTSSHRQIMCTSSFSTESKFLTSISGGVNLHVEHHLFPAYPMPFLIKIHFFLKKHYSKEYKIYPSVFIAIKKQLLFLKTQGRKNDKDCI